MVYKFREGFRLSADPQVVGERLTIIKEKNGGDLTSEAVLKDAKYANSPLHNEFEWDDSVAAKKHRLAQAGYIVRSVVEVKVEFLPTDQDHTHPIFVTTGRAFLPIVKDSTRVFKTLTEVMSDEDMRNQVLAEAKSKLISVRHNYKSLNELAEVFAAIDHVVGPSVPVKEKKAA